MAGMDELSKWIYPLNTLVTFLAVFLKGFQHKNVIGNHLKSIFFTSYLMAAFDVLAITLTVKGGLWMIPFVGTGAAVGMIAAILFHDKIFKHKG